LSRRLREADQRIESLALNDIRTRVEQALHGLAEPENGELVIPGGQCRSSVVPEVRCLFRQDKL
jgi:hypothetical protein